MTERQSLRLGLVINPYAGIGGPTALKGSDGVVNEALARGGELRAEARVLRCLQLLRAKQLAAQLDIVTFGGEMGENMLMQAGLTAIVLGQASARHSNADDTKRAAQAFIDHSVDLIVFAGGDGTARDVCAVVGEKVAVLGLPSGVKMQSGVFAVTPEAVAEVIGLMLVGGLVNVCRQEVRDIDEAAYRQGRVRSRHYGDMQVPEVGQLVQQTKSGGGQVEALILDDIAAALIDELEPDTLYLIGAGTTTEAVMVALGLDNTLLGVDMVLNNKQVGKDCSALELDAYLATFNGPVVAVLTITGGQGSLLGRGNQQLSPTVLRRIGKENIRVIATRAKIAELNGRPLIIDTNDAQLDQVFSGYYQVLTGYRDAIIYPASCGYGQVLTGLL